MNPTSMTIRDMLVTGGVGTFAATTGWSIHIGDEPTTPATVITIYDTGGSDPTSFADRTISMVEEPGIQVRVRANSYLAAYAKMLAVIAVLDLPARFNKTEGADTVRYCFMKRQGDITSLGKDEKERYIITQNFRVIRKKT